MKSNGKATRPKHVIVGYNLLYSIVCSSGTWDEALEWIRRAYPAGTENNWHKAREENQQPVTCESNPARRHYMFVC